MPRILENEASEVIRSIDSAPESERPWMVDLLERYKRQQDDNGEPEWPSQVQAEQEKKDRLRGMFNDLKTVDAIAPSLAAILPYSDNPDADRARVANTAYLASRYGKTADEINASPDLYRNDYATRFLQAPKGLDDLAFYAAAAKEIQRVKQKEDTEIEGHKAALRGDDVIPALQAWQAKNLDRMPDSTEFTRGFLQARERSGDQLEFADTLLKQIESNTGLTKGEGATRPAPASREMAAQFEESLSTLAAMKPKDQNYVFAILSAKAEAAGYDRKGFWAQMLSNLGTGMARMGDSSSSFVADMFAGGALAESAGGGGGGGFSSAVPTDAMERFNADVDARGKRGVMYAKIAGIVADEIDPYRPTLSWMNDSLEEGLVKGPGAVAPFMMASAALGLFGGGVLFAADFAEQNRRNLILSGMDDGRARLVGMTAAPFQAAVESLSNMLQLGRFPSVQRFLAPFSKPISAGGGWLGRYAQNVSASLGIELFEEHFQDNVIVPVIQNVAAAFDEDMPGVGVGEMWNNIKSSTPELFWTLLPMAFVFGGSMTSAQAQLSSAAISSQDMLEAAGYSAAQANEVRIQPTEEAKIAKARQFWGARAGTPQSIETAAKTVSERMRMLQGDAIAAQKDLESRGILPRMLRASESAWRLTFNDGSTADFNNHREADAARWQWATDQLGKVHLATRSALAQLESGAAVGREFAVEFKPDVMTAQMAVEEGRVDPAQIQRRVQQGAAVGESAAEPVNETETFDNAVATDKATSDYLASLQILGSSSNEFKDGVLRTTIRLYEGANVLTLVEEKLEGDAKQIIASKPGREWMLAKLREYERVSGDSLFRKVADDSELQNDDLIEAWSSLGQSYLVGKSKKGAAIGKGGGRRIFADVLKAGMAGAMNSETQFFNAVWRRAAKLSKLKREGKLGDDLTEELERQLGIDSQTKFENESAVEAEAIANEALNAGGASYSEENPGPNGETFSMSRATPADVSQQTVMPDGARLVGPTTFSVADYGINHRPNNEGPRAFDLLENGISPSDVYQHPEWYSAMEPKVIRETMAQLRKVKGNPKAELTIYRAGPKGEMNGGDWVSLSKEYARTHAEAQDPEGFKVWQAQVAADSVRWALDDLAEFGYFGDTVAASDSGETFSIRAYHGTPHKVDKFRTSRIGTGAGAQVYGWGLYFAQSRKVAQSYQKGLTERDFIRKVREVFSKFDSSNDAIEALKEIEMSDGQRQLIEALRNADWWGFDYPHQAVQAALREPENFDPSPEVLKALDSFGQLYTVELLADEADFLDWDKPLSEQSEKVRDAASELMAALATTTREKLLALEEKQRGEAVRLGFNRSPIDMDKAIEMQLEEANASGAGLYKLVKGVQGKATPDVASEAASQYLASLGIPGIKYLDGGSRGAGEGTSNYVIFDENLVKILEENGKPVETFSLRSVSPSQDAEYMAAVEAGDIKTAQRMVDEAAKAAGYNVGPVWHYGAKGITEFRPFAREFMSGDRTGEQVDAFIRRAKEGQKIGTMDFRAGTFFTPQRGSYSGYGPQEYGVYLKVENAAKRVSEQPWKLDVPGKAFDAIMMDMDGDGVVKEIAIIDPAKIKSADPVTYDESGNVIPLSQRFNPDDNRITYSLRSGDFASRMAAAFSPFQRNPELRLAIAQVAKARALKLGAEWIEKASVIRTSGDIGKEARMREALAYETRMNDYLDGLTPNARQTLEFEPSALEDDPLVSAMLDYGKLMSFTNAKKAGKVDAKAGDYDGVPWLPSSFYSKGAGIMPDQMAQAMNDAGLLPDAYADTLWNELGKRIDSTKKDKAAHREAVTAYKAAQKYAKDASRAEADQWAEGAKKKAGSPKTQRDMLKAALRTLDGILAAAPPEVRAKVGGYVKLAGLATDEAMLQEIERRIEKLNVELEKYLKKEGIEQIEKLFKKARPDSEAGKRGKGKNADMHALFAAAERAAKMDEVAVAGELARLDSLIGGDTLTPEQEAMAITERGIVELVGDLKHADAGRVFSALDTLRDIYEGGWIKWKLAQIEKREERAGMRAAFIADTGKSGIKPERDAAEREAETLLGKIKGGFLSLSSFHEVLSYAFGSNSARVKSLVDAEREAAGQYEDANQALADEVQDLFTGLAGGKVLAGEKLRFDMAQRTIQTAKGELSQLGAIQALLMWRQEDGRRHMEGQLGEDGKPISSWSYDQAWIDEITAQLTPEARSVMAWIMQKYGAEHAVLNPLNRQRYGVNMPAHDNYAPITVQPVQAKAGEVIDPVSGAAMSSGSILTPGSLRTRSRNAIAEPEFRDALQTLLMHTRQLEYWKAYYDLALESSAILGNREVLNSVKAKGGEQAATALRKWIDAIAQGGFRDASASLEMNKMLQRMTGRAASVGLLGRFSTLLVQSTQLAAASVKMPIGSYLVGMSKLLTGNLGYGDAIRSPFIQRRYKSAPPIVRQAMEGLAAASRPNQIKRATRALGQLLSGTDALFTAGTYALLLDYHRGTGRALGLTGADLEEHAHTEAQRDTEQVAQPTRMAARSLAEITSTNPLAKVSWAYASEARQKIALLAWAATKVKSEPAQFAKTAFLVFGVGGLLTTILKNLWREAKGDDDEKKWSAERLTLAALTGPLHGVPLASELMGDQGMLSGVAWAWPALKDVASREADMRDVDTLLSTLGLFNDTAAAVASLSHAGLDAAKVIENLADKK